MNLDDIFGPDPRRPDTPEFWKLSEIILGYDGGTQNVSHEEAEEFWRKTLKEAGVDQDSLIYMASQRALRALNAIDGPLTTVRLMALFTSLWQEGFLVGEKFGQGRT